MDRLKFRVFDKVNNCYSKTEFVIDYCGDLWVFDKYDDTVRCIGKCDRFIIEPCTGLKDSNGNLVFENDQVFDELANCEAVVVYISLGYSFEYYDGSLGTFHGNCKIIGNIHEVGK